MLISSTAFYREFDYDLALKNEGKEVEYTEDYSDVWSQYMLGVAHRYGYVTINPKHIKDKKFRALSFEKDELKVTEYSSKSHGTNWRLFYNGFKKTGTDGVYLLRNGRIYTFSGKLKNRNGWSFGGLRLVALWQ